MTTHTLRPLSVTIGTEFFLVEHMGTRQIISEVVMEATSGAESITKMSSNDYIMVKNKISGDLVELVKHNDKNHLIINGKKHRVTFMSINQDSILIKKLSDEHNNAIEQRKDLATVAKNAALEAAEYRKESRKVNKSNKKFINKKDKLEIVKTKLTKRMNTLKDELKQTEMKIKNIENELAEESNTVIV